MLTEFSCYVGEPKEDCFHLQTNLVPLSVCKGTGYGEREGGRQRAELRKPILSADGEFELQH